ncbi:MAG: hypothetical protein ABGY28_04480, partial [bacterium]
MLKSILSVAGGRSFCAAVAFVVAGVVAAPGSVYAQAQEPTAKTGCGDVGAFEALASFGPINEFGYPGYYVDQNNVGLDLCDETTDVDPFCGNPPFGDPLGEGLPLDEPANIANGNFWHETFYQLGNATMTFTGGDALLVLAVEGVWDNEAEAILDGDQLVFSRIRARVSVPNDPACAGTYTLTHPYGTDTFEVTEADITATAGLRVINYTDDCLHGVIDGVITPNCGVLPGPGIVGGDQFTNVTDPTRSRQSHYLTWNAAAPAAPAGYIGDPAIPHAVTGSPCGTNVYRIEGPAACIPGGSVETDQFNLSGRIASFCGDGFVDTSVGETCDDGNTVGGDCCSDTCLIEGTDPTTCDDGDACTADSCDSITGCANTVIDCNDAVGCTVDTCDSLTGCVNTVDDAFCDDALFCNGSETCHATLDCQAGLAPTTDDGVACTADSCDEADDVVVNTPVDAACDDLNGCTDDSCDAVTDCVNANNTVSCDDGDACTQTDTCAGGACVGADPVLCSALSECHEVGTCDTASGICSDPASAGGKLCGDGGDTECTNPDTCDGAGSCQANDEADSVTCGDAGTECVVQDTCDGGGSCSDNGFVDADSACGDGSDTECTNADSCDGSGSCQANNEGSEALCGDAGTECVVQDTCDGGGSCSDNGFVAADSACGDDSDTECSNADTCDGAGGCQVNDEAASVTCGDAGTDCVNQDFCNGGGTCADNGFVAADTSCDDDGNGCTDDACDGGGTCLHPDNTIVCDDGNACTTSDVCADGDCSGVDTSATDCDDANGCTDDSCDATTGCASTNNTVACDDSDACTDGDVCSGGLCASGPALDCNDDNVCTDDFCNSAVGCHNASNIVSCDDGDACTTDDTCAGSACVGGVAPNCDDSDVCTDDICDSSTGCVSSNNTAGCDDNDACTTMDACADGTCLGGPALVCDDGLYCTGVETCDSATGCMDNADPVADDGVACTDDSCDEAADVIVNAANDGNCDDGLYCTGVETCHSAMGCMDNADPNADDGVACTDDSCDEAADVIVNAVNDGNCDDGLYCTGVETCHAAMDCQDNADPDPDDGVACTVDTCDEATDSLVNTPNHGACDDGLYCTGVESCDAAMGCMDNADPVADDGVACTDDSCDEVGDAIVNTANDGNCDDGLYCTGVESCDAAMGCMDNADPVADDGVACTDDSCDEAA